MQKAFRFSITIILHTEDGTYMLHPSNLQRANKLFQNDTSQLKVKIAQEVIKRDVVIWKTQ